MLQVKKIVGNLLASNMYLLFEASSADCWLIDIGDFSALAKELPNDVCVRGVFLTHTHFDHIAGVNELCNMFPECKVYTSIKAEKRYPNPRIWACLHAVPASKSVVGIG